MNYLNYPPTVDPRALVGRVMGPDRFGAMYEVVSTERQGATYFTVDGPNDWHSTAIWLDNNMHRTRATLTPISPGRWIAIAQARESNEHGEMMVPVHLRTSHD